MARTVLVVEDEFLIAEDMRIVLEAFGWVVLGPAPTVKASLHLLEGELPAVAVLDMQLGKELVTPVAKALRELGIPFIASSSYVNLEAIGGEEFSGIVNVGKPYLAQHLQAALLGAVAAT
jgi:two-component system, response regulator PdtaR